MAVGQARAAAGDLDPTFGVQGRTIKTIPNPDPQSDPYNSPEDMVIQPDGKIVVAGYAYDTQDSMDFFVVRFNPNGSVDTSFASNGVFRFDFDGGTDELYGVALQADGRIVAAGAVQINPFNPEPNTAWAIIRLTPSGAFDPTFGTNGLVLTDHMLSLDEATEIAIQPDQRILVSGWSTRGNTNNTAYDFAVARYLPNGSLDTTFGTGGVTFTDFAGRGDLAHASVLQPDGKLVVSGAVSTQPGEDYDFGTARYNPDGSLDTTFGTAGRVTTRFLVPGSNELARGVALAPDGKIVVTGDIRYPITGGEGTHSDVATARYLPNGALDPAFSGDGRFIYDSGIPDRNEDSDDVVIQPDGKPVLLGKSRLVQEHVPGIGSVAHVNFLLLRLSTNGELDPAFGNGGIVHTDFGIFNPAPLGSTRTGDRGRSLLLQPDGKIVAAGLAAGITNSNAPGRAGDTGLRSPEGRLDGRLVLARYQNDISLRRPDFDFDGDGRSDMGVFRPSDTIWYLMRSGSTPAAAQFGLATDRLVPADFDGDGKTDIAVFRTGTWYWINSSDGAIRTVPFGRSGDVPMPGDLNGDGRAELTVYRGGTWWTYNPATGQSAAVWFGTAGDMPMLADFDGDGRGDQAVYRNGDWHINGSAQGYRRVSFGLASDKPVAADYDGDGRADPAVFRDGIWHVLASTQGYSGRQFGIASDIPVPADYDGDGRADPAVYRGGTWYLLRSTQGFAGTQFGAAGDVPVAAAYLP